MAEVIREEGKEVSRVDAFGETLIDLTNDTVNEEVTLEGYTGHNAAGKSFEGTLKVITTGIVGEVISYMGTIPPDYFLNCDGSLYNISEYPYLANHFATNFGSVNFFGGDGETTFAVPDLRGEFLRGTGTATRNTGSGANVGVHQNGSNHVSSYAGGVNAINPRSPSNANIFPTGMDKVVSTFSNVWIGSGQGYDMGADHPLIYTSRPTNTAVMYCIRYRPAFMADNEGMLEIEKEITDIRTKMVPTNTFLVTEPGTPADAMLTADLNNRLNEVNNNLSTLNDNGTILDFHIGPDGKPYITYKVGADTVIKKLGSDPLIEETFSGFTSSNTQYSISLKETPKKLIIIQGGNRHGISFPSNISFTGSSDELLNYFSYDYEAIILIQHEANSKIIKFMLTSQAIAASNWVKVIYI